MGAAARCISGYFRCRNPETLPAGRSLMAQRAGAELLLCKRPWAGGGLVEGETPPLPVTGTKQDAAGTALPGEGLGDRRHCLLHVSVAGVGGPGTPLFRGLCSLQATAIREAGGKSRVQGWDDGWRWGTSPLALGPAGPGRSWLMCS